MSVRIERGVASGNKEGRCGKNKFKLYASMPNKYRTQYVQSKSRPTVNLQGRIRCHGNVDKGCGQ